MGKVLCTVGIISVMIGTIFSLWSVLTTKTQYYGTYRWVSDLHDNFKKDKKKVVIGIILIIIGSILQIMGVFI